MLEKIDMDILWSIIIKIYKSVNIFVQIYLIKGVLLFMLVFMTKNYSII